MSWIYYIKEIGIIAFAGFLRNFQHITKITKSRFKICNCRQGLD
jgi:hypothetical protein